MLVDTHAHLSSAAFNPDRERVLRRAAEAGIRAVVDVGYDLPSSLRAAQLARSSRGAAAGADAHPGAAPVAAAPGLPYIAATVGIHPHDVAKARPADYSRLEEMARDPVVVAVGEIGLDYYRDLSPRDVQRKAFEWQIAVAARIGKPVCVHCRDAHADALAILRAALPGASEGRGRGVMHCYSGSPEMAEEFLKLGLYVALAGPVTYDNARRQREVARAVPVDRLLVETDCPYLTPVPFRGKRNEPAYVGYVARAVAEARGDDVERISDITSRNAQALFGLALRM